MAAKTQKAVKRTRILVVDDHPLVRFALSQMLNNTKDLVCCGEADGVGTARAAVTKLLPDVVLLDLSLGDGDGFELIAEWKRLAPGMKVLVVSRHDEAVYAERSIRMGADGFVTKEESPDEVLSGIRLVLTGRRYVSEKIAGVVMRRLTESAHGEGRQGVESLSNRELQVFRMLGEGRNNKEIAEQLSLSPKTVETYRENLKRKLGLPDSVSLIRHAANWSDRD
ncbi:MAG: DNA-binding response regulator [Proteobacteria bacterium]|nr:DNA-binding response regulator [Pseudomonadota bacterium]